jgi:N-acetylglucosaminyldiphosphoundecaprenol N-acetyl-beta-D-mannosaminyltransferase
VTLESALAWIESQIGSHGRHEILAMNPEKVIQIRTNEKLRQLFTGASLLIPDGIGVVVAARLLSGATMRRVPGCELMPLICSVAARLGTRVFVFGAAKETNETAVAALLRRYPGLNVVGTQDGYLPEEQMPNLVSRINESRADILFVALGSPRQELWMEKYLPQLNVSVCQGIGGTLDVLAGNVMRAPALFRRLNLEWAYRLLAQPKRLLRQTALPRFAALVLLTAAGIHKEQSPNHQAKI